LSSPSDLPEVLLGLARDDEFAARSLLPIPGVADSILGFHAQQAVKKSLKAALASRRIGFGLCDPCAVSAIGFLHTAESHVERFGALVRDLDPARVHVHVVRPDLLERARLDGLDDETLGHELRGALRDLGERDARVVICTCSTLGGVSEQHGFDAGIDVLRVDRPMAELAVRSGSRIGVVVALESTLSPTRALLCDAAIAARKEITVVDARCFDAWARFEEGDIEGYHRDIAGCVDALDATIEVVVLAQASMAGATALVKTDRVVLSSPRPAVEAALRLAAFSD
jgi:hypothetical protein